MFSNLKYYTPFILVIVVYVIGLFIDVMDIDAAQLASMGREMVETGDYLTLTNRYQDYLDKPNLTFWLSAFSFKIFGVYNFAYKLPSLLFLLLGIYSVFQLGKLLYEKEIGYVSAIVFASSMGAFIMANDIRADTVLTGATTFSIWQLTSFTRTNKIKHLILGFLGAGLGMAAKGPMGIMLPALALGSDFIITRKWNYFLKWQWLLGILVVGITITPVLISLYTQFDMHPEKVIKGETNVSGVKFFLWTQSFGRITGENQWRDDSTPLFFTHTLLWTMLPWGFFMAVGYFKEWRKLIQNKFRASEGILLGGFTLTFIALSLSKYKLPHYIYVVVPLAAVFTAKVIWYDYLQGNRYRIFNFIQLFIAMAFWGLVFAMLFWAFPLNNLFLYVFTVVLFLISLYFLVRNGFSRINILSASFISTVGVFFLINLKFYPSLLSYQTTNDIGRMIKMGDLPENRTYMFGNVIPHQSMDFYADKVIPNIHSIEQVQHKLQEEFVWIYTKEAGVQKIKEAGIFIDTIISKPYYQPALLTFEFINPKTRAQTLQKRYLIKVSSENK